MPARCRWWLNVSSLHVLSFQYLHSLYHASALRRLSHLPRHLLAQRSSEGGSLHLDLKSIKGEDHAIWKHKLINIMNKKCKFS